MKGLKLVINCETNIQNLITIEKMARRENLDNVADFCHKKIKKLVKEEKGKIKEELEKENESNCLQTKYKKCYCAKCNKEIDFEFRSKSLYAWKIDRAYFCSWSCYSLVFDGKNKKRRKI